MPAAPHVPLSIWIAFNLFVLAMLALDLGIFHRRAREMRFREAAGWSLMWVALSLGFWVLLRWWRGPHDALDYLTGYLLEKSLSVDNLFVFLLIFRYFKVPRLHQHTVLFWGVVGALLMRGAFIAAGVTLLARFEWVIYIFGGFLIYSGLKLLHHRKEEIHPEKNPLLRLFKRLVPSTHDYVDNKLLVRQAGRWMATPLLAVLLVVETTDVLFATDSIPAILAITRDAFIVYTSNVFAILGLRALYFVLAGMMDLFHYLHHGLAVVLVFIGVKMLLAHAYPIPTWVALCVVGGVLAVAVGASLLFPAKKAAPGSP
ncbi:MAG TPA: TerC family protein [Terriglobales bacterium]|nr:TerC family protein [Terriglobales bacterium]